MDWSLESKEWMETVKTGWSKGQEVINSPGNSRIGNLNPQIRPITDPYFHPNGFCFELVLRTMIHSILTKLKSALFLYTKSKIKNNSIRRAHIRVKVNLAKPEL